MNNLILNDRTKNDIIVVTTIINNNELQQQRASPPPQQRGVSQSNTHRQIKTALHQTYK